MSAPDKKIVRAFMMAASNGRTDVLEQMLAEYPDAVRWRHPEFGGTGFANAIGGGAFAKAAVPLLLAQGSDINAQDNEGRTPLILAVERDLEEHALFLLGLGADTTARTGKGLTALDIARKSGGEMGGKLTKILLAHEEMISGRELAAQAHTGLDHQVRVRKPIKLKI